MIANADHLVIGLAVVEHRQHGDRRPNRRAERESCANRRCLWLSRNRGRGVNRERLAGLASLVA
jgi:hypothetical protein